MLSNKKLETFVSLADNDFIITNAALDLKITPQRTSAIVREIKDDISFEPFIYSANLGCGGVHPITKLTNEGEIFYSLARGILEKHKMIDAINVTQKKGPDGLPKKLSDHLARMKRTRSIGCGYEWRDFIKTLRECIK